MYIEINTGGQLRKRIHVPDEQLPNVPWLQWETNVELRQEFIKDILSLFYENVAPMFDHDPTVEYYLIFESKMHLYDEEHCTETPPAG